MPAPLSDSARLQAARRLLAFVAAKAELPLSVRLWDGSTVALGAEEAAQGHILVTGPEVLGALLRRPSLDTLFRVYAKGGLEAEGLNLIQLFTLLRQGRKRARPSLGALLRGLPWSAMLPLLTARGPVGQVQHAYGGDEEAKDRARRDDKRLVQFHYDVSNDFYALFLDPEMVYSCAYFRSWETPLEQAQRDKLDLICRKLRLQPGERFLDIGCGWGALLCHAAQHYGVEAHGVTLSQEQFDFAQHKVAALGLQDRVTIQLEDYRNLEGRWDKIASIGMYEHVGIAGYPAYFRKIRDLLADGGVFLNHGITRRAKGKQRKFGRISGGKRVILKYIFPGSELDHIGHTAQQMEAAGFEVHDVEGLRRHYARTCALWYERLAAQRAEAVALVGAERYRMWLAYLAGVALGFDQGPLRLFQTVATRLAADGSAPLPPTRADLYEERGLQAP
ncbi:cyclopropane-fatty-acyl-phospholipid synthase family protein [Aquibaculum sediminis]|uniref:cyclopropane-fatty-acyl-phospholipid synthase family protein n=1 Tax=Aquibaculum sediminis TaxID=3231907 RepID=UPI0034566736